MIYLLSKKELQKIDWASASANCRHYIIRRMRTNDHVKVKGDSCSKQKKKKKKKKKKKEHLTTYLHRPRTAILSSSKSERVK